MPNPHTLTRDQMRAITERGETVIHYDAAGQRHLLTHPDHVPSAAQLAQGDAAAESAAAAEIDAQIATLAAQRRALRSVTEAQAGAGTEEKPEGDPPKKEDAPPAGGPTDGPIKDKK